MATEDTVTDTLLQVIADITAERYKQLAKGYTPELDAYLHGAAELECVAAYLVNPDANADAPAAWAARIKAKWGGNAYRLTIIAAALLVAAAEVRRAQSIA